MNGADVVAEARSWLGTPYVHQASARGAGADCLGLLRGIWRSLIGPEPLKVPAYTPDWSEPSGHEELMAACDRCLVRKPLGAAAEGDVLLFRMRPGAVAKHLGILVRPGPNASFIHAYGGHGTVESPLSEPWAERIAARYAFPERTD
ncbi:peptidase [Cereibacter sphaeroides]|jgi:NlpC/P60 family putative phage cell wall peptidase|uniref:peptidase n=1 Tax=Cereibacter sphaeroides TaxID=1063 RepID=UPI0000663BDB|nr:putative phage cell wall peptidase, NlpC/P60 family [Cereibacter sphaeroides ATCC 17029]